MPERSPWRSPARVWACLQSPPGHTQYPGPWGFSFWCLSFEHVDGRASRSSLFPLCSLASGSVAHGRHACLRFTCGFSRCSSEMLFLRPCCSECGLGASSLSVTRDLLEVETLGPRPAGPCPRLLNLALSSETPSPILCTFRSAVHSRRQIISPPV